MSYEKQDEVVTPDSGKNKKLSVLGALILLVSAPYVSAGTDIGAPDDGVFAQIGEFLQDVVDLLEGPAGLFIAIAALFAAVAAWVFASRSGEGMGWIARVVIGVLVIINIPVWVVALQGIGG